MPSTKQTTTLSSLDRFAPPLLIQAFLFYGLPDASSLELLTTSLNQGLRNATSQIPLLAGSLHTSASGIPYISTSPDDKIDLVVRHLSPKEHRPFSELKERNFQPDELNYTLLLPALNGENKPACVAQLSVLGDGVVFAIAMQHTLGDWTSLDAFLGLVCKGSRAYADQQTPMPVYTPDFNRTPFNGQGAPSSTPQEELLSKCPHYYILDLRTFKFTLPAEGIVFGARVYRIKEDAVSTLKAMCKDLEGIEYVSSYDVIAAVVWTAITRARLHCSPEKNSKETLLLHPVNLRARDPAGVSSGEYFGNAVVPVQAGGIGMGDLVEGGIRIAAGLIRKSSQGVNLSSPAIRDLAALIRSLSPMQRLGYQTDFHGTDVLMNSWFSGKGENYDLGVGGLSAFRIHRPVTGAYCCVLPDLSRGSSRVFDLFVQLREEEHAFLQRDGEFLRFFELVA